MRLQTINNRNERVKMATLEEQAAKYESHQEFENLRKAQNHADYIFNLGWEAGASDDQLQEIHFELIGF